MPAANDPTTLDGVEVLVDLQTGAISIVIPGGTDEDEAVELETVTPDDPWCPQE